MKYISTFNESNQDDKITDRDLELHTTEIYADGEQELQRGPFDIKLV